MRIKARGLRARRPRSRSGQRGRGARATRCARTRSLARDRVASSPGTDDARVTLRAPATRSRRTSSSRRRSSSSRTQWEATADAQWVCTFEELPPSVRSRGRRDRLERHAFPRRGADRARARREEAYRMGPARLRARRSRLRRGRQGRAGSQALAHCAARPASGATPSRISRAMSRARQERGRWQLPVRRRRARHVGPRSRPVTSGRAKCRPTRSLRCRSRSRSRPASRAHRGRAHRSAASTSAARSSLRTGRRACRVWFWQPRQRVNTCMASAETDGVFALGPLARGTFTPDRPPYNTYLSSPAISVNAPAKDVVLVTRPGAEVAGKVIDRQSGAGVQSSITDRRRRRIVDDQRTQAGRNAFRFDGLETGRTRSSLPPRPGRPACCRASCSRPARRPRASRSCSSPAQVAHPLRGQRRRSGHRAPQRRHHRRRWHRGREEHDDDRRAGTHRGLVPLPGPRTTRGA